MLFGCKVKQWLLYMLVVIMIHIPYQGFSILLAPGKISAEVSHTTAQLNRYLRDTISSLECMRGENGLIADKVIVFPDSPYLKGHSAYAKCPVQIVLEDTSPTNIGFDLLVLLSLGKTSKIQAVLETLHSLPFHTESGLFFNRYSLGQPAQVKDHYVSAVDNIHLALSLWMITEVGGQTQSSLARTLLQRMQFADLQDSQSGLIRGGYYWQNGKHYREGWYYAHFGAEARTLYALGWAFGLLPRKVNIEKMLVEVAFDSSDAQRKKPMLRLWDGGTFQMLLPELLIKESSYSPRLQSLYSNYSSWVLSKISHSPSALPVAHSASQIGPVQWTHSGEVCGSEPCYLGKAGHKLLISRYNGDRSNQKYANLWERASTLHGVILSALWNTPFYMQQLLKGENLGSVQQPLYRPGLGWLDSFLLDGTDRNQVVPFQLSLDQGMIALALERLLSRDGEALSSRALRANNTIRTRLQDIYSDWDDFIAQVIERENGV